MLFHLDAAVELAEKVPAIFSLNLGWILPAVLGLIIGLCSRNEENPAGLRVRPQGFLMSSQERFRFRRISIALSSISGVTL